MLNKKTIERIAQVDNERYGGRLKTLGPIIRTLGWDTKENQFKRFQSAVSLLNLQGKSVVDFGCGFGDFFEFLKINKIKVASYLGIDINPGLLDEAKKRHKNGKFQCLNILLNQAKNKLADIGFAFGVLNFNLKGKPNNYDYSKEFIKRGYSLCKEVFVVDMLSSYLTKNYPKEGFVFYHSPEKMFKFALGLTPNIILKHDCEPIPQKEFTLYLKRNDNE
ncbi:class I SAM-dependent methyltransferase [Candidatus Parcubacteria bacterium]|nr:class I SAM-dependent methyltransferase [Candidatus Parcubacteria bacterium]